MDDIEGEEMPGAIVEAFLEREEGVRALLEELEKLTIEGRHADVRDRLRNLADSDEAVFYTVAFSLTNSRQFFGDVEAQLDVTAADRLRDLAETYPALALATPTTHDLFTIAGHWTGRDLPVRGEIGLLGDAEGRAAAERERAEDRTALAGALQDQGLLPADFGPESTDVESLIAAVHGFVARTPSALCVVNLDDLAGEPEQINVPGTTDQYPNWRRRLTVDLEDLMDSSLARAALATVRAERG